MEDKRRAANMEYAGESHLLSLGDRRHLKLEGVRNVISFSEEEILLETTAGNLHIKGEDLHIQQLNLDDGHLVVDGSFTALTYLGEGLAKKGRSFLSRLLR